MDPDAAFPSAIREWSEAVGSEHVLVDEPSLERASTATFATTERVGAIVRPASRAEVAACLQVASRRGVPIYPVSGGKNWGLGSRVPNVDRAALLDLGRLDRILELDEQLGWVTIEPGVTFRRLYQHLAERGSRLFVNSTGGSPDASVIANALERGDGAGPYGDRASAICALEVVLPTGECVHTGFGRFGDGPVAPLHRWGVGPALDGLFLQSNLGVVTRATLWLAPLPRWLGAVRFAVADPARLPALVDGLRELRQDGTLRSVLGLWNDYRVLSVSSSYPWERTAGATPLAREVLAELARAWGGATWMGLAGLFAPTAELGVALCKHVERVLGPLADRVTIEGRSGEPRSGQELFRETEPALQYLQGIPHQASLASLYWRKHEPVPSVIDPDRDRCGVLWLCPTLPFRGSDVVRAAELVERIALEHGFEPLSAMVAHAERTLHFVPMLTYDRDEPGADERARACHDQLFAAFCQAGFWPNRLGHQSMGSLPPPADDYAALLERIEQALDPAGILAPGRYDFRARRRREG